MKLFSVFVTDFPIRPSTEPSSSQLTEHRDILLCLSSKQWRKVEAEQSINCGGHCPLARQTLSCKDKIFISWTLYASIFHQYNLNTYWTQLGPMRGQYSGRDFTHTHNTHIAHTSRCVCRFTHAHRSDNFNGHPKKRPAKARTTHFLFLFTQLNEIGWSDHSRGENQHHPWCSPWPR